MRPARRKARQTRCVERLVCSCRFFFFSFTLLDFHRKCCRRTLSPNSPARFFLRSDPRVVLSPPACLSPALTAFLLKSDSPEKMFYSKQSGISSLHGQLTESSSFVSSRSSPLFSASDDSDLVSSSCCEAALLSTLLGRTRGVVYVLFSFSMPSSFLLPAGLSASLSCYACDAAPASAASSRACPCVCACLDFI